MRRRVRPRVPDGHPRGRRGAAPAPVHAHRRQRGQHRGLGRVLIVHLIRGNRERQGARSHGRRRVRPLYRRTTGRRRRACR